MRVCTVSHTQIIKFYIYIYMRVLACTIMQCMCMRCVPACTYIPGKFAYICIHVLFVRLRVCMFVCMGARLCAWVRAYVYIYVCE